MRATGHVARGLLSRDGSLRLPCGSTSLQFRRVVGSTPIRYYGILWLLRLFVFALPGDDPPMSTSRLPSSSRSWHHALSFSVLLLRGVPEAHLEGRGIPITVEEVIEIFMVSSASRNFDATDIHWSCVIICLRSFFLARFLYLRANQRRRERERERATSDTAREKPQRFDRK